MKKLLVLIICLVFIRAERGFAEPLKEHSLGVSTEMSYIIYDEPNVMEEKDMMYGVGASYTYRKDYMFKEVDFLIEPFVRYWNIEQSETENITYSGALWGYGWEPENNSTEIGIRLSAIL